MQTRTLIFFTGTQASSDGVRLTQPVVSASSQVTGALSFTIPAILGGAAVEAQSQLVATLSGVTEVGLPCPGFPVARIEQLPVRASDVESGVVVAESAPRIWHRTVSLDWSAISHADRSMLLEAWAGGRGLIRRFQFTVPGEGSPRRFVFQDDALDLQSATSVGWSGRVTLRDVSRGGE